MFSRSSPKTLLPILSRRLFSGERLSDPVDIDNTPPVVTPFGTPQTVGDKTRVVFDAADSASYLTRAEYSVNGGEWQPVYADDGISDSPKERYTIELTLRSPGEYSVTLRVYDVNSNAGNAGRVVVHRIGLLTFCGARLP
jgi:hypothetical protein